ncbi:MAG: CCA tRNA nucleotidyltransferase [Boseongicola sp.]|nr:CCA tRNA nucleotidyltransferase [Boseongicola sp.]
MSKLEADWLVAEATQRVFSLLADAGHKVYAVGGCVRNALLGELVNDVDFATDAPPDRVLELAKRAGLKTVPTGILHGTVGVIAGGILHEVTTFRRDVATDGRRAVVEFSDRIEDDAQRRDFTMNALYVDAGGVVHDPLGGQADLVARRVRFIGDPEARIREDCLRSLRYFRFHAWYCTSSEGFDPEAIAAIAANLDGLSGLSRERVGSELKRLLSAPDPAQAVAAMRSSGVLAAVLPGSSDNALGNLVALERGLGVAADPMRRLAVMGGDGLADRLKLSRREAQRLRDVQGHGETDPGEAGYRLGAAVARDAMLAACAVSGRLLSAETLELIEHGAAQAFPVKAADLSPAFEGPELGMALDRLERKWIASGFALGRQDLLALTKG